MATRGRPKNDRPALVHEGVRMHPNTLARLRKYAKENGISLSAAKRQAIVAGSLMLSGGCDVPFDTGHEEARARR